MIDDDGLPTSDDRRPERLTVTFTADNAEALHNLSEGDRLSKGGLVNAAVSLYAALRPELDRGGQLYIHDPATGQQTRLLII